MFISQNTTPFLAEAFTAQDKRAVKACIAVVRATFDVDADGTCTPSPEQSAFVFADAHYGDPETTSVRVESDFVPTKPRAEVLLDAVAMAPGGQYAEMVEVALLGPQLDKRAVVVGERHWFNGALGVQATRPVPFRQIPLAWHMTFGGTDRTYLDASRHRSDVRNPVGRGYLTNGSPEAIERAPLPCIERPDARMSHWQDRPEPIGFGPVPRFASERARFAGTYDQDWMDNTLPFLPADFDTRYFQAAPADQQVGRLAAGTGFLCVNMSESGRFLVRVPELAVPVRFNFDDGPTSATILPDTLILMPHEGRIVLVGRSGVPLPRKFTRLRDITVGPPQTPRPVPGKPHYKRLSHAVSALSAAKRRR
jgi:hypothetical protein